MLTLVYGTYCERPIPNYHILTQYRRTVAITPFRSGNFDFDEVKRVCQSCTLTGLQAMYEAQEGRPFRFIYLSAEGTPDDPTKKPIFMGDYQIMRVSNQGPQSYLEY